MDHHPPVKHTRPTSGFTLPEILVGMALMGIVMVVGVRFTQTILKGLFRSNAMAQQNELLRQASAMINIDFFKAIKIVQADTNTLVFYVDAANEKGFGLPLSGNDPYGMPRRHSYDRDMDATVVPVQLAPVMVDGRQAGECCVGNDLDDDDDDNDGKVDVKITYQFVGTPRRLERFAQYNEGAISNRMTVIENLDPIKSSFTYFGSMAYMTGIPPANPVVAATTGEDAGLVQGTEIDLKIGNINSTAYDNQLERNWISVIRFQLALTPTKSDIKQTVLMEEITPPLLPLKKKANWP